MDGDDDFLGQFQEEYDAFFEASNDLASTDAAVEVSKQPTNDGATRDIESEYALLSQHLQSVGGDCTQAPRQPTKAGAGKVATETATMFALDGDEDDDLNMDMVQSEYTLDCRPPELPEPPADFTGEDLKLRNKLAEFYLRYRSENLANINGIVKQYRGRAVTELWVRLAVKYSLAATDVVDLLAGTLYMTSPFECADEGQATALDQHARELQAVSAGAMDVPSDRAELIERSIEAGTTQSSDAMLRMLCFRGIPGYPTELRAQAWKIMLGYLPVAQQSEWTAIQGAKRALYASRKKELIVVTADHTLEVQGHFDAGAQDVLHQIQKDVDRTRHEFEHFQRPATRAALMALLFIYSRLNPDVRYVQGMNEIAAVIFYVMSVDPDSAEADAFWCFSSLMAEIKGGFIQALDQSCEGVQASVGIAERLLRTYDPDLARHLHKNECPLAVFSFRWCALLFAQDASLADVVRLWDSLIADPRRFEFVVHISLAATLACREELLRTEDEGALAEILRSAPRHKSIDDLLRRAWAICALERRKQAPPFPVKSASQLVHEISGWAQSAATRAQEVGVGVARSIHHNIAPAMKERAGHELQVWLEEKAPSRHEAYSKAQTTVVSLWQTVRTTGSKAVSTNPRLSTAVDTAANASSTVYSCVASALTTKPDCAGERQGSVLLATSTNYDAM